MRRVPRFGDAPRRGPPPASAEEVARLLRRVGVGSGLLVVWALAGVLASVAFGSARGLDLALYGALPLAALALGALFVDLRRPSRAASALAASSATLALAFAFAGHALHWGGFNLRALLLTSPTSARIVAFTLVLLLVPLYAGARAKALRLAWNATGSRARGPVALVETLARGVGAQRREDEALAPPDWRGAWKGALLRWAEGLALPGLLVLDVAMLARRPDDRLHAETTSDAIAEALAGQGATVERKGRELVVRLADAEPLRVSPTRTLIPDGPAIDVRGRVDDARRLRRLIEGAASHAALFTWSQTARRWERRIDALHRDALVAASLEERSLVMEELDRVRVAIAGRALCGEEFTILALKEANARGLLAHRMLSEPPGVRTEVRVLAQHGALLPEIERVLKAGGLASVRRVAFVPHWIVPVETPWGEQEVVVSAATGKLDRAESAALLAAMRRRGPVLFLDVGAQATFLPAPRPTAALLREAREQGFVVADSVATGETPTDIVYVPYLATAEGYVSGVTGTLAPDLGNAVPVAASA